MQSWNKNTTLQVSKSQDHKWKLSSEEIRDLIFKSAS